MRCVLTSVRYGAYVYVYVCMCVCVCVYIYIYIYQFFLVLNHFCMLSCTEYKACPNCEWLYTESERSLCSLKLKRPNCSSNNISIMRLNACFLFLNSCSPLFSTWSTSMTWWNLARIRSSPMTLSILPLVWRLVNPLTRAALGAEKFHQCIF